MGKIYTKKGDDGYSNVFLSNDRLHKTEHIFELLGGIDELNSFIGVLKETIIKKEDHAILSKVQTELIMASAVISGYELPIKDSIISDLENEIDKIYDKCGPVKEFIIPDGISSYAHVCRTITRRVERDLWGFYQHDIKLYWQNIYLIGKYLNRLSDYFFTLAIKINASVIRSIE